MAAHSSQTVCAVSAAVGFLRAMAAMARSTKYDVSPARVAT